MSVLTPSNVFASGRKPPKSEIIQLFEQIMGTASAPAVVKATKAALDLVTPASETYGGLVLNDSDATKNGYYYRSSSTWVKGRGFPDTIAVLTSIGGTANAITASTAAGVNPADVLCVLLPDPPGTNSSSSVTLALNGGAATAVKAASGAALAIGDIIEGVGTLFFKVGSEWRQLFSSQTGAIFDHQGDYAEGTTYTQGQVVTGSNGNWFQLKEPSSLDDDPVTGGSGAWLLILAAGTIPDGAVTDDKVGAGANINVSKIASTETGDNSPYALSKVIKEYPPSVERWRTKANGTARTDTETLQAAAAASRSLLIEPRIYEISATIPFQSEVHLEAAIPSKSVIRRMGVWSGNTITVGQNLAGQGAYALHIKGLKFEQYHPGFVPGTTTSLADRLTGGQHHLDIWGGTYGKIEDCSFEGGAACLGIYGAAYLDVLQCTFKGSYDYATVGLQETLFSVYMANDAVHGLTTKPNLQKCNFEGYPTPTRTVTRGAASFSSHEDGGPRTHVYVAGAEGLILQPKYIGAANDCLVEFSPQGAGVLSICNNIDITGGFWDSANQAQIKFDSSDAAKFTSMVSISNLRLNAQQLGRYAVWVNNSSGAATVSGLMLNNLIGQGHNMTPLNLLGARSVWASALRFASFNTRNGGDNDPSYAAGAFVSGNSSDVNFDGCKFGGGLNSFASDTTAKWGPYFTGALGTASNIRADLGIPGGTVVGGISQTYPT